MSYKVILSITSSTLSFIFFQTAFVGQLFSIAQASDSSKTQTAGAIGPSKTRIIFPHRYFFSAGLCFLIYIRLVLPYLLLSRTFSNRKNLFQILFGKIIFSAIAFNDTGSFGFSRQAISYTFSKPYCPFVDNDSTPPFFKFLLYCSD